MNTDTQTDRYHFFYKSKLANWHMCRFIVWGQTFVNGEQAMMWAKAKLFGDIETAAMIMETTSPKEMQRLGRLVKNYNQTKWDDYKIAIMTQLSTARFQQNPYLMDILLATGSRDLVESSPIDKVWGIGLTAEDAMKVDESEWPGQNLLGKCLTDTRNQFRYNKLNLLYPLSPESQKFLNN